MRVSMKDMYMVPPGVTMKCVDEIGIFIGKEMTTDEYELWTGIRKVCINELLNEAEEEEVEVIGTKINLDALIYVATADILLLANDRWTLEEKDRHFDITMYIDKLNVLVAVKDALGSVEVR
jgi:hypothetical protein